MSIFRLRDQVVYKAFGQPDELFVRIPLAAARCRSGSPIVCLLLSLSGRATPSALGGRPGEEWAESR